MDGQRALVVGAASGIGRSTVRLLAERGAKIVCADIDELAAKSVSEDLRTGGASATSVKVDVTTERSVHAAVDHAEQWLGGVTILVNCAGITGTTGIPSHEVDPDDFDAVYRVNLRGAFLLSRAVLPGMRHRQYGRILHVASIAGKEGNAGMVAYSATKAGLIGMVKAQGKEYAEQGITVNALAPAVIHTPMVAAMPAHQVDYMIERIPMRRTGSLAEAAETIAWIVSPASSFTTGFTYDLSGGRAVY
jgi:2-dehydro-3-deoxy-L-rhamnonate dehydrogenase (NAD+)